MEINLDLVGRTLDRIIADPNKWDQSAFCGTTFCFAGHALLAEGYGINAWGGLVDPNGDYLWSTATAAARELGFTYQQEEDIFYFFPEDLITEAGGEWSKGESLRLLINRVAEVTGIDPEPYLAKVADLP